MFRRTALRRFSSLRPTQYRLPSSFQHHPNGEPVKFHRVAFRKPGLFTRRRIINILGYAVPFAIICYVWLPAIEVQLEEEGEEEEVEIDDDELEDGFFIPFGWPRKVPKTYYKGTDPEWQSYVKLARDKPRTNEIAVGLAKGIRSEFKKTTGRNLPGITVNQGKYWLYFNYPKGPPQDYQVSGLEISYDFVAWSTKTIPQKEYLRLLKTIFPRGAIWATHAAFRYHFDMQANKVRAYFGFKPRVDREALFIRSHLLQNKMFTKTPAPSGPALTPPQQSTTGTQKASSKVSATQKAESPADTEQKFPTATSSSQKPTSSSSTDGDQADIGLPKLPFPMPQGEQVPMTFTIFLHNMRKFEKKQYTQPPRGCVEVRGLVEVVSKTSHVILDVLAIYDLKDSKFLDWNYEIKDIVRKQITPVRQRPNPVVKG